MCVCVCVVCEYIYVVFGLFCSVWSMGSALQSPLALLNDFCRGTLKTKPDIATHECNSEASAIAHRSILSYCELAQILSLVCNNYVCIFGDRNT